MAQDKTDLLLNKQGLKTLIEELRKLIDYNFEALDLIDWQEFQSVAELPNVGKIRTLYIIKTSGKEMVCIWNSKDLKYMIIGTNYMNINVIKGGNA